MPDNTVLDVYGQTGQIIDHSRDFTKALVRLPDGFEVWVDETMLKNKNGTLTLPVSFNSLAPDEEKAQDLPAGATRVTEETVIEEQPLAPAPIPSELEEDLESEDVDIERIPVNRYVDAPQPVRHEGETTIFPLVEEVLVVERKLMLREEVRVTKRKELRRKQPIVIRSDHRAGEPGGHTE